VATNVEIKARVMDIDALRKRVEAICNSFGELIEQEDIFFKVDSGRLKLRILAPDRGQLIFYQRPDRAGPKVSEYHISETTEPDKLESVLSKALGIRGVVSKDRYLYWIDQTRIHLDQVEGLGDFLELEVVLRPDQSWEQGTAIAADIMEKLQISPDDLIEGAYMDLLENSQLLEQDITT
jgi:predicted adenylyl cyclase CyaB